MARHGRKRKHRCAAKSLCTKRSPRYIGKSRLLPASSFEFYRMDHSNRNSVEDDMRVVPVEGGLGARIEGIDLSLPLTEKNRVVIRQPLGMRGVVSFPGKKITAKMDKGREGEKRG